MKNFLNSIARSIRKVWWFVSGLAGNIKQWTLEMLGHIRIYNKPLWFVVNPAPFQIKARQIRKALAILEPGDVVVRKYKTYLSSYFIPGRFSHSGLYCGETVHDGVAIGYVTHSVGTGVQMQDIMDFFMDCDEFAVLRPNCDEETKRKACEIARSYIGTQYDYNFDICESYDNEDEVQKRTKSVYCHELTRSCYPHLDIPTLKPSLWGGMIRSDKSQFLAQSFFESPDFYVVFDSFYSEVHS